MTQDDKRQFETSDFYQFRDLFLPPAYRESFFRFVQNCVIRKEDIGRKVTGDGQIILTNWHIFLKKEDDESVDSSVSVDVWDDPSRIIADIFPVSP